VTNGTVSIKWKKGGEYIVSSRSHSPPHPGRRATSPARGPACNHRMAEGRGLDTASLIPERLTYGGQLPIAYHGRRATSPARLPMW